MTLRTASVGHVVRLYHSELQALRGLEGWAVALFMEMVALADWRSGEGRTTYRELEKLIAPTPERGRAVFTPSAKQIERAVDKFEERGLIFRDPRVNTAGKLLIFAVHCRTWGETVLRSNSGANSGGVFHWRNAANSGANSGASSLGISLLKRGAAVDNSAPVDNMTGPSAEVRKQLDALAASFRVRAGGTSHGKQTPATDAARAPAPAGPAGIDQQAVKAPAQGTARGAVHVAALHTAEGRRWRTGGTGAAAGTVGKKTVIRKEGNDF